MLIFFTVAMIASIVGAICGIGGGVIIKPVLDFLHLETVSTISFMSSCTVLTMSCYSVGRSMLSRDRRVDVRTGTPLAIGAAVGGLLGNRLFSLIRDMSPDPNAVGSVQAICLAVVTLGTLLYTVNKHRIHTHSVSGLPACVTIGLVLGCMSSFLGIGGGPINLVVLYFFFSMETKTAAANSLYIILFSQIASVVFTVISGAVPPFRWEVLVLMAAGGIGGGITGRALNRKMDDAAVEKLFVVLMAVIIGISVMNAWRYA